MWKAPKLTLRPKQKEVLEHIAKSRTARSDHQQRARLILLFDQGVSNNQAGQHISLTKKQAGSWRKRWLANQDRLTEIELAADSKPGSLLKAVEGLLCDLPRSGTPPKFTAEQIAKILSIACEDPQTCGLPLSHWSLTTLQREVIDRGVVESISISRLQVFLKSGRIKTSQSGRVDTHLP